MLKFSNMSCCPLCLAFRLGAGDNSAKVLLYFEIRGMNVDFSLGKGCGECGLCLLLYVCHHANISCKRWRKERIEQPPQMICAVKVQQIVVYLQELRGQRCLKDPQINRKADSKTD